MCDHTVIYAEVTYSVKYLNYENGLIYKEQAEEVPTNINTVTIVKFSCDYH